MKKFLLLSLFAFLGIALNAQLLRVGESGHAIRKYASTSDVASGTTAKAWEIEVNRDYPYLYAIVVELDSAGNGTDFTVELEGSYDGTEYWDILSYRWGVTTSDTTILMSSLSATKTVSSTIAQHTETTAAHNEIRRGTATDASYLMVWDTASANGDSITVGSVATTFADTVAVGAQTNTVAAQTITTTETVAYMGYKFLQVKLTGDGSSAGATLVSISVAIIRRP